MPLVGVIMESASDETDVKTTLDTLEQMGIDYEARVMSAHRTPSGCMSMHQPPGTEG